MADQSGRAKRGRKTGAGNAFLTADSDAVRREPERATTSNSRARGGGEREEIRMETPEAEEEEVVRANRERGRVRIVRIGRDGRFRVDPQVSDRERT